MRRNVKQLIVGWNRGGLGYVLKLLSLAGAEVGYTFDRHTTSDNLEERIDQSKALEVSPYLVPFLDHERLRDMPVTFIVRDPMRVLNSLYFYGLFHGERHSTVEEFAFQYLPSFEREYRGKPAQASCSYLNRWLWLARQSRPNLRVIRVEEGPRALLKSFLDFTGDVPYCEPDVNSSGCKQKIVPSDLPEKSGVAMIKLLMQLGYREWMWAPRGGHAHYINPDWHC